MKKKINITYTTFITIALSIYVIILFVVSTKHIASLNECFEILKTNPDMITSVYNLNATSWANYLYIERILGVTGVLLIVIHAFLIHALLKAYKGTTLNMLAGNIQKTSNSENKELKKKNSELEAEVDRLKNELITRQLEFEDVSDQLKELKGE